MPTFHCLPLFLKESGLPLQPVCKDETFSSPFEDWALHTFYRGPHKQFLFVHFRTFFSLAVPDVFNRGFPQTLENFRLEISRVMLCQDFSAEEIRSVVTVLSGGAQFRVHTGRGMSGVISETARMYNEFSDFAEQRREENPSYANLQLNEIPLEVLDHELPLEVFRSLVAESLGVRRKAA